MEHRVKGSKLGRVKDQRVALLRSLVAELVKHERITTTEAKAKEARRVAEQLITYGKKAALAQGLSLQGGQASSNSRALHYRRLALSELPNEEAVKKVFENLAQRYAQRPGGYTRMVKVGTRKGDAAPVVVLELVP